MLLYMSRMPEFQIPLWASGSCRIINVVIHEPDARISDTSLGSLMILFLRGENEAGSYALIHARMRSPEHDEEILQVIESGTDLSVDPPN